MPIEPTKLIWKDGRFVRWSEASTHVLAQGLHYGAGVFEGVRSYTTTRGPAAFRLTDHIRRLFKSAKCITLEIPYSIEEIVDAVKQTVGVNELPEVYIRPIVFSGYGEMGLMPLARPETIIAVWPWGNYLGDAGLHEGVRIKTSSWRRIAVDALPPQAKVTSHYLNSTLAKFEATSAGYDEALFLNPDGTICDGAGENFFIVRDGVILTPPLAKSGLPGITRATVIALAGCAGIEVREQDLLLPDAYAADEAFFTGTAVEVMPISEIDDRRIGPPGPITKHLQGAFLRAVHGRGDADPAWNEYIS